MDALKTELNNKEWIDKKRPIKILDYFETMDSLIQSWQE